MISTLFNASRARHLCLLVSLMWATASTANSNYTPYYLSEWLKSSGLEFNGITVAADPLRGVYATTQYQPIWVDDRGLNRRGEEVLAVLAGAEAHGINPERYGVSTLKIINAMPRSDEEMTTRITLSLELLMSQAVMRYTSDVHGGATRPQWNTGAPAPTTAQTQQYLMQVMASPTAAATLAAMAPARPEYLQLQQTLTQYRTLASKGGWPTLTTGKTIKPGMSDPRVATIQQILVATGDLAALPVATAQPIYDSITEQAVMRFQARHNIEADGVIGSGTQAALAVPVEDRIEQIAMTLERMRWMPDDLGTRYVMVNVPAYQLTAVSGEDVLNMPVIVGKPTTRTPMFSKEITDVIFNPSWGVPSKIAVNEMLPKLKKDPSYLERGGYTLVQTGVGEVDPYTVDWQALDHSNFDYSIRQNPGDGNALGKVKFNIPNSDNIYLHDTSQPKLFSRADRKLSHGCIRLSDPKALASFVLKHEGWEQAKIDRTYDSDTSRSVRVTPIPVHLVYWTSWVDNSGRPHFSQDIYGLDKKLEVAMGNSLVPSGTESRVTLASN